MEKRGAYVITGNTYLILADVHLKKGAESHDFHKFYLHHAS